MATTCKYCGKLLQDGEICSCPQAQAEAAQQYQSQQPQQPPQGYQPPPQGYQPPYQPPQRPAGPNPVGGAFQKLLPYITSYFKTPVTAAQNLVAHKDIVFAAVLLCIQVIVGGLMTFSFVGSYLKNLRSFSYSTGIVLSGPYYGNDVVEDQIDTLEKNDAFDAIKGFSANFFMSLIFGILAAVIVIAIFVLIAFAVSKIAGSSCSILDVVVAAAAHSPLVTVLLLLTFILFFVSLVAGLICLLATVLAWIVLAIPTLQTLAPNSATQGKFWISAFAGILVAVMIGTWAAYSIGSMSVGYATYKKGGKSYTINELRDEENALVYLDRAYRGAEVNLD